MPLPPYQQPVLEGLPHRMAREWLLYLQNLIAGGATGGGGGSAASASAPFVVTATTGSLPNSAVLTTSSTISVNTATTGQVSFDYLGAFLQTVSITLTNAQVQTLPTTPVQIVAAAGVGTWLQLIAAVLTLDATAAAYTNIDAAGYLYIQYASGRQYSAFLANDATLVPARSYLSDMFGTAGVSTVVLEPFADTVETSLWGNLAVPYGQAQIENSGLELIWNNGGSGNVVGNAANTLRVDTIYRVQTL